MTRHPTFAAAEQIIQRHVLGQLSARQLIEQLVGLEPVEFGDAVDCYGEPVVEGVVAAAGCAFDSGGLPCPLFNEVMAGLYAADHAVRGKRMRIESDPLRASR